MKPNRKKLTAWLDAIGRTRVLVFGDLMLDHYIWGDASRISPEAPVPVVKVERESFTAGGAANVALNLRALGAQVLLFGRLGRDANGQRLADLMRQHGVELVADSFSDDLSTIVKTRVVCRMQQLCRLDREAEPASFGLDPAAIRQILAPLMPELSAIILSDYAKGLITTSAIATIQALEKCPSLLALDPKPRPSLTHQGTGLLTPNRNEALQLAGLMDEGGAFPAAEVCRRIFERHRPERLVVTLGGEGMLLSEQGEVGQHIPTVAREVFDVSGAGDTVIAALTAGLAAGLSLADAAALANTAAGVVVGKLGTATASPAELLEHAECLA